jgi:hypothetical protein
MNVWADGRGVGMWDIRNWPMRTGRGGGGGGVGPDDDMAETLVEEDWRVEAGKWRIPIDSACVHESAGLQAPNWAEYMNPQMSATKNSFNFSAA